MQPTRPPDAPATAGAHTDSAAAMRPRPVARRALDVVRRRRLPACRPAARRSGGSPRSTGSRALLARRGAPPTAPSTVDATTRPTASTRRADRPSTSARASGVPAPGDRVAARRLRRTSARRSRRRRPRRGRARRADRVIGSTGTAHERRATATCRRGRRGSPAPPSCSSTPASRDVRRATSRSSSATARTLTVVTVQDWADDAVHLAQHDAARRPRRHAAGTSSSPSAATSCGSTPTSTLRRPRRRRRAARRSTSPTPASTSSTGCSSTTTRRTAAATSTYKGALQGEGAHTVWIGDVLIRAGGRGHRHLRAQPQPACSPTAPAPTRCRTSRSRPARSSAPGTPAPPAASTTSSCSTCRRAASPRTRPAAWSCAASSPSIIQPDRRARASRSACMAAIEAELAERVA